MKGELNKILGKYKVIGDTTFGIGYVEANNLVDEIIATCIKTISTHTEHNGGYCDTGEDMDWECRSNCIDLAKERLNKD